MDTIEKFDVENDDLLEFKRETSNFKNDTIIRAVGDFSLANEPSQELINFIGHHENSDRPFILNCYRFYHKKNWWNTTDNIKDFEKEFDYFNYIRQSFTDKIPEKYRESFETKVKDKIISWSWKYFTEIVQGEIIDTIRKIDDKDLLNFYWINYDESSVRTKAFIVKFYVKSGHISKDKILDYVNWYETLQGSLSHIDEWNSWMVLSLKTIDEDNSISESDKFEHDLWNITTLFNKNIDESYINNTVLWSIQIDKQYYSSLNSYFYNSDFKNLVIKNNWIISLKDLESLWKIWEAIKLNVRTKYEEDFVRNMFETLSINKTTNRDELKKAIESQPNNELKSYLLWWKKNIDDKPIEEILWEWLYTNWYIITDMSFDDTKLRQVSEQQSRRLMSNKRFIERLKEKNRQINKSLPKLDNENLFVVEWDEWWDSMWTQLAKDAWIWWKDLEWYSSTSLKLSKEEMNQIEIDALPIAWHNFIEKKWEIWDYFNKIDVRDMYNFETKAFNQTLLNEKIAEIIDKSWDDVDVTNLRTSIEWFYSEMEDAISELTKNYVEAKKTSFDDSKVNAIGWVIDSISSIFDKISNSNWLCEGFKYAEKDPISLDWDLLTIKGLLNGEKTKISYNLRSGELFMNSFIKESNNPQMIKIWDRQDEKDGYPEADKNIWKIEKFEDIIPDIETSTEIVNNQPIDEVNYNRQIAGMNYVSNGWHSIQTDPDFHSSSPWTPQSQTNARDIFW